MSTYKLIRKDEVMYHFGVKGMKWGRRKARQLGSAVGAMYAVNRDKVRNINNKRKNQTAADIATRQRAEANYQAKRKEVSASRSGGAKLATNLLAGPFANRTYNSVIASGGSKNKARAVTAVATICGGPIGHLAVSALYKKSAGYDAI